MHFLYSAASFHKTYENTVVFNISSLPPNVPTDSEAAREGLTAGWMKINLIRFAEQAKMAAD